MGVKWQTSICLWEGKGIWEKERVEEIGIMLYIDFCNFTNKENSHTCEVEIQAMQKYAILATLLKKQQLFCQKSFRNWAGGVHTWENFQSGYQVLATAILSESFRNWAGVFIHGKIFSLVTKCLVFPTEISVTMPAHPVILLLQSFFFSNDLVVQYAEPSQHGSSLRGRRPKLREWSAHTFHPVSRPFGCLLWRLTSLIWRDPILWYIYIALPTSFGYTLAGKERRQLD